MHSTTERPSFLTQRRTLIYALIAGVIVYVLWNIPQLDFIVYPLRLFVTFVHETAHGLAALITGGQIDRLQVFANGAGVATTRGGIRWIIIPAGYLGAAAFGAGLFYVINRFGNVKRISIVLGILTALVAILFTNLLSTAFLIGLGIAALLIGIGIKAHEDIALLVLDVLAIITGLNAVLDLFSLSRSIHMSVGSVRNDAVAFSAQVAPIIPPVIWALLWSALAVLMLGAAVYYTFIKRKF